ncbi:hypothetical protein MLD38_005996 [Melastoma candidum]|uniref:Uncharacterized protein n=1 Tax=Melastoma candidum TaxID=119954 RepID=A0ACB9RL71_9MYRT|nr:hypothetical protein MLD38_005996 [Melastoma candidum]
MTTSITKNGTNGTAAKPRRGASPSSDSGIPIRRGSILSEKPIPSYLRPTASSRGEIPKEAKKKALLSPDNRKAALGRRSSFDRPPSASHLQKIMSTSPGERSITVRSSSFTGSTGAVYNRPASERTSVVPSRAAKAAPRTHLVNNVGGRAVAKKSGSTASRRSSVAAKNKEKSVNAPTVVVHGDESGDDNSGMIAKADGEKLASPTGEEAEQVLEPAQPENITLEDEVPEVVVHEDLNHGVVHAESDVADEEEIRVVNGVVSASKEEEEDDDKKSNVAAPLPGEEVHKEIKDKEEEIVPDDLKGEEEEAEVPKAVLEAGEAEDKEEDNPVVESAGVAAKEEKEAGDMAKEADVVTSGSDKPDEVKEPEAGNVEDEKQAVPETVKQRIEKPAAAVATAPPPGKKDPAQANNDIIEETTKKLMESSRRNKVKALAGAFETVILLEKPGQA